MAGGEVELVGGAQADLDDVGAACGGAAAEGAGQAGRRGAHVVADDDRGGVGDGDEGGAEQLGERLVPLVGDDAADVVRLHDLREVGHSSSRMNSAGQRVGGERRTPTYLPWWRDCGARRGVPVQGRVTAGRWPGVTAGRVTARVSAVRAGVRGGRPRWGRPRGRPRAFLGAGGFADGVGECFEVVAGGPGGAGVDGEPDDLPAAGGGEALGVLGAQVVAVRFRVGGERSEDRGGVRVDVRQRRDGGTTARGARTTTYRAHDVGRYRTLERAATTLHDLTRSCRRVMAGVCGPVTCGPARGGGSAGVGAGGVRRLSRQMVPHVVREAFNGADAIGPVWVVIAHWGTSPQLYAGRPEGVLPATARRAARRGEGRRLRCT